MHRRLLFALFLILAACPSLFAQSADYATVSEESRRAIILTLSLDEEQTELLDDLLDGYVADAVEINADFGRRILAVEESDEERTTRFGLRKGLEVERDRVLIANRNTLFDDLALVLDDEQAERVEVARLRLVRAPMFEELSGDASGFTADPIRVAEELALYDLLSPEELERFDDAMSGYDRTIASRLDAFLRVRERFARDVASDDEETRENAGDVFVESMIKAIIRLRSAHANGLRSIAPSLPAPLDDAWRDTALRLSHPQVFDDTWGERVITSLLGEEGLTEMERQRLREIAQQFTPRYEAARVRIAREIERAEGRVTVEQAKRSSFITINDPEVVEARRALRDLNEQARSAIVNALDPALRELVPPLPGS